MEELRLMTGQQMTPYCWPVFRSSQWHRDDALVSLLVGQMSFNQPHQAHWLIHLWPIGALHSTTLLRRSKLHPGNSRHRGSTTLRLRSKPHLDSNHHRDSMNSLSHSRPHLGSSHHQGSKTLPL